MDGFTRATAPRRTRRAIALTAVAAALMASPLSQAALMATETRSVADFDTVVFAVPGEVRIEQGARETLTLECESAVLRKLTSEVRGRQLIIGVAAPGRIETQQPIRIKLGVRTLRGLESRAPSAIRTGPLRTDSLALVLAGGGSIRVEHLENASSLDVKITGAGDVAVGGGRVKDQQLAIRGIGSYAASRLASESADVAIDGNADVQLAASSTLAVRIGGIGHVRYHGNPVVARSIRGIGSIEKD
ncbi:hypothetical protein GCM10027034_30880 [Ramlibacter solisilvae]|uniref:Putative auto-transporter adhesin head GIN domain-containing protein n=1 Tax=Ramlibacter tataouinensis TaxID=94132 RepID=A0A127JRS3_9BURK|nr:DUF2807 domain-containing protein [Ramlibacter tataouinensis]AMO22647.1 hypothetical protein UC35_06815 [Ramlibacter tataouinensis]